MENNLTSNQSKSQVTLGDDSLPDKEINQIFLRLTAIYGYRFTSTFSGKEGKLIKIAKAEWGNALAKLSSFQLEQGLRRARLLSDWNPNIPEFIRLATNLPSQGLAVDRTIKRNIVDPVTRDICSLIGNYNLNNESKKNIEKKASAYYFDSYERVVIQVMGAKANWEPPVKLAYENKPEEIKKTEGLGEVYIGKAREALSKKSGKESKLAKSKISLDEDLENKKTDDELEKIDQVLKKHYGNKENDNE